MPCGLLFRDDFYLFRADNIHYIGEKSKGKPTALGSVFAHTKQTNKSVSIYYYNNI